MSRLLWWDYGRRRRTLAREWFSRQCRRNSTLTGAGFHIRRRWGTSMGDDGESHNHAHEDCYTNQKYLMALGRTDKWTRNEPIPTAILIAVPCGRAFGLAPGESPKVGMGNGELREDMGAEDADRCGGRLCLGSSNSGDRTYSTGMRLCAVTKYPYLHPKTLISKHLEAPESLAESVSQSSVPQNPIGLKGRSGCVVICIKIDRKDTKGRREADGDNNEILWIQPKTEGLDVRLQRGTGNLGEGWQECLWGWKSGIAEFVWEVGGNTSTQVADRPSGEKHVGRGPKIRVECELCESRRSIAFGNTRGDGRYCRPMPWPLPLLAWHLQMPDVRW